MPYAIQSIDKPGHTQLRADKRPEHLAYLKSHVARLIAAGGLLEDDATGGKGGIILLDTDDRAEAERFAAEDPYTLAGLFEKVTITRWRKAFLDGQCLL